MTGPVALVATPGGHIDEAFDIADRFAIHADRFWITARTPQTETLLADERVAWVPEVKARQGMRAVGSFGAALRIMRANRPRLLVSTGSALTVPYMVAARCSRVPVTYVESATRLTDPSLTGRIAERIPGVRLFQQGTAWNRPRWGSHASVFDEYVCNPGDARPVQRALVTLGTEQFPFSRAVEAVRNALPNVQVTWQTGNTPVDGFSLPGDVRAWWRADALATVARDQDVVITHAGVGSILMVLRAGRCPLVIPRMKQFQEHVDDHQAELAEQLEERGLVVVARPGDDLAQRANEAARRRVVRKQST